MTLWIAGCGGTASHPVSSTSAPAPGPASGVADGPPAHLPADTSARCSGLPPAPDYECVRECGPPVSSDTDPPLAWHWMSPEAAKKRALYGCPRCLPADTRIATPDGERAISRLSPGSRIYTIDATGRRAEAFVLHVGSTPVTGGHELVRVALADGRIVSGSCGHPDGAGRALGELRAGARLDGSVVVRVEIVPFAGDRTWDILPSGPTGLYVANGVVLRSTLSRRPPTGRGRPGAAQTP